MMIRKMLVLALAASLCLAAAGCAGSQKTEETLSESEQQAIGESLAGEMDAMVESLAPELKESLTAEAAETEAAAEGTASEETSPAEESAADDAAEVPDAIAQEASAAEVEIPPVALPFMYTGNNPYTPAVIKWMEEVPASYYEEGEYYIPAPAFLYTDARDQSDILIWGDFQVFRYDLEGENLVCQSGGSHPGLLHLRALEEDPDQYEVFDFEAVADGSDMDESLQAICDKAPAEAGDLYAKFNAAFEDGTYEEARKEYIKMYAEQVPFTIKSYQDYGWDPVMLDE